ncbi:hypothetical protein ETD83_29530 [Actinomadura soli]|uniref:Uncharacterized protein n=1 Tax=Actinomadura soli TaxID=2508997 RepID=A0A5C4J4P5_9ACTN|nr:hypothetical protein [Actinomadura soli]TMQ91745.1 hypothetical protein ETD83_29530 [Actinomadura soli]
MATLSRTSERDPKMLDYFHFASFAEFLAGSVFGAVVATLSIATYVALRAPRSTHSWAEFALALFIGLAGGVTFCMALNGRSLSQFVFVVASLLVGGLIGGILAPALGVRRDEYGFAKQNRRKVSDLQGENKQLRADNAKLRRLLGIPDNN